MIPIPGRKALRNPIFRGALETMTRQGTRWTHALNYAAVLSLALFITWPKEGFLSLRDLPFTYNAMGGTATIILAYLNFTQGARHLMAGREVSLRDWLAFTPLPAGALLRGYLAAGAVETLFFWGLTWPLMVLAAGVSGESFAHLAAGMMVLLACLAAYRMIGVTLLIWFERDDFVLYILVRVVYLWFILVSGFVWPHANPVLAFIDTSIWPRRLSSVNIVLADTEFTAPGWAATVALHLILGGLFSIIAALRTRRLQRLALRDASEGDEDDGTVGPS
ncbi:MAG: hypothetical protein OXP66_09370 [Candidatus Tectomicrobia bacterium]|nr:hypothetical protein [Candidatus Tectomicrobia bacterium]